MYIYIYLVSYLCTKYILCDKYTSDVYLCKWVNERQKEKFIECFVILYEIKFHFEGELKFIVWL